MATEKLETEIRQEQIAEAALARCCTLAVMFLGLVQPAAILWDMSNGEFDITQHAEGAWSVFRTAIAAAPGSHRRGPGD